MSNTQGTVQWFRGAAPYIKAHRKKTFVVMVSDEVIYSDRFIGLVHDIALLNHLGIKLVILHGSRRSIDSHLEKNKFDANFHQNIRITDSAALPFVVQAINEVKTYFESQLSMGFIDGFTEYPHVRFGNLTGERQFRNRHAVRRNRRG